MKPIQNPQSKKSQRGSTLIITMTLSVFVLIVLASYLTLLESRSIGRARSMGWNKAIPVLEAGIEEAFTHLTDDKANLATNGWTLASGVYKKTRTLSDGSYCIVTISNAATTPVIYSQGFVPAPFGTGYIHRLVRVNLSSSGNPLFSKAILTSGTVIFTSGMIIKSYDSSNTNLSNPDGTYNTNLYGANAWVASTLSSGQSLKISGTEIYGGIQYAAGATALVSGSSVGDVAWVNGNSTAGVEAGYSNNTLNITIPPTPLPTNGAGGTVDPSTWPVLSPLATPITTNGIANVCYVVPAGDWSINTGTTVHNQSIYVSGNARLYVPKTSRWQGGSSDVINVPKGNSLQIYNDSSTDAVFPNVENDGGIPSQFLYWGLPDTAGTKLTLTGNGFCACGIYAYYQLVVLTGGSSGNGIDFYGALVAQSVTSSGHLWMAYDQALANLFGGSGSLVMSSYIELPN